jgi:hypothetical protein
MSFTYPNIQLMLSLKTNSTFKTEQFLQCTQTWIHIHCKGKRHGKCLKYHGMVYGGAGV